MTALTFTLRQATKQRIDCSPLTPDKLQGKTIEEIAELPLVVGNKTSSVISLFSITPGDHQHIKIANSQSELDYIGEGMGAGKITIEGNVGAYLGLLMTAGEIEVNGSSDYFTGCEMAGGVIHIHGNAGNQVASVRPGRKNGMTGGTIIIAGNAGDRVGDHMRRGNVLIAGSAGDYCAARMISGTIMVLGEVGHHLGYAMKRGTVLLMKSPQYGITANFNDCGQHSLAFLPLLLSSFKQWNSPFSTLVSFSSVQRYAGDMAGIGLGEILVKQG